MISGAVVLGVLAAGVLVARLQQVPARAATAHRAVPATITIDPQIGETFAPAPSSATPRLTAQQAWQRYAEQAHSSRATIPSFVTAAWALHAAGRAGRPWHWSPRPEERRGLHRAYPVGLRVQFAVWMCINGPLCNVLARCSLHRVDIP